MRTKEDLYRELGLGEVSGDALIRAMHQYPKLIERPNRDQERSGPHRPSARAGAGDPQVSTRFARLLTLVGFFGLLGWVILWHLWLSPHPDLNPWLLPVIWTVPLLFPLKGIVQGNPYTHAWGNFVLMPYFLHALTLITTDEGERWLAVVELVFTTARLHRHHLLRPPARPRAGPEHSQEEG